MTAIAPRESSNPREALRRKITRGIVLQTGTREQIAMEYADAVMRVLDDERAANGTVYVPAPARQYDVLQMRAALENGTPRRTVCKTFGVSYRTLTRLVGDDFLSALPTSGNFAETAG